MKKSIALLLILCFIISPFTVVPMAEAAGTYTVMGKVVDRNGNAVSGATVQLVNDETYGLNWNILGTQTTDPNGNFRFLNIVSNSALFKVFITYTESGRTFKVSEKDSQWTDGSQTLVEIDRKWTTLYDYPPPEYGFIAGIMLAEGGNSRALGNGVVYVVSNEQRYYSFTANNGAFKMLLPVGHYRVYGQYAENGILFQSSKIVDVDVYGASSDLDYNPLQLMVYLAAPASNPVPDHIPETFVNTVNGTVTYQDGNGVPGAMVTLWQSPDDNSGNYFKKAETTTDSNGNYLFNDVKVTTNPPASKEIYGMKTFRVSASYTDPEGNQHVKNQSFPLYNPNVILGIGQSEQSARNMSANLQFDYSTLGWIKIQTDASTPAGAKVFVDGQPLMGPDGKQLTTPCTAYIPAGRHTVTLKMAGFVDSSYPVDMVENLESQTLIAHMEKPMVPGWVVPAVAVLILLIVAGLILAVIASKRHMFIGPLSGVFAPIGKSVDNFRSSSAAKKAQREAQKAHAAENRKTEKAHRSQMADSSLVSKPKIDGRRREQESFHVSAEQPRLPEHVGEDLSMVSAREIYRKTENRGVERIPHAQATGSMAKTFGGHDMPPREPAYRESPITAEPDGRIRVPRAMPAARDPQVSNLQDKERVVRYVREHGDGVSFIQMSNELEIPPNTLTIITKELVINDDIEKVRGLYFHKKHDTSSDEGKSSVVVWRLDGED